MFDAKELTTVLNSFYEAGVKDDMLALTYEANKNVTTKNIYMYKGQFEIPPLIMQDDTLSVSTCGYKTTKINNLVNTRTNIMGLQVRR